MTLSTAALVERFVAVLGPSQVLTDPADTEPFQQDWRERYRGAALAVLLPGSTDEVSSLVQTCVSLGVAVVPQGGNTGLTGGAVAVGDWPSVILNLSRLNRIREIDARNNSLTAEAGCILANVRGAAEAHQRQFPLLVGSAGSCEIGGLVSTNAGGTGVLRYGTMRELVLGLEVVLPDGSIWDGLRSVRKDNAGYDLKQLFIGAEGTLGIVTAAVLKLFPRLNVSATAMVSLAGVHQAVDLLRFMQEQVGNRVEAFEIMSRRQIEVVVKHGHGLQSPMELNSPWFVLVEIADSSPQWDAVTDLETMLESAFERGLATNAVIATDVAKANRIWDLRHSISEANKREGFTVSTDTSVPVSKLSQFIDLVTERVEQQITGATVCHVGHIGDGNIHVIALLSHAVYGTPDQCEATAAQVNLVVHEASTELGGSISAEHGIGRMHVDRLERFKPAIDLWMMRMLKNAFDPMNYMNPGTILRAQPPS